MWEIIDCEGPSKFKNSRYNYEVLSITVHPSMNLTTTLKVVTKIVGMFFWLIVVWFWTC
jgi:hypothetical protein